jgi:hypothetical protein
LVTTTGATFPNVLRCVVYSVRGGTLKRLQTISFTSTNPSPVNVGGTYTPTASATSGLPVAITIDPASSGVCSRSGQVVTYQATGTCTIDADQAGNATYAAARRVHQSVSVVRRTQSVSFTSADPSPVTVGGTYTPTASATSGLPVAITIDPASSGVCSQSGEAVTFDSAGTCAIDANQAGDATFDPASPVQQSVTVQVPANPSQAACESVGGVFSLTTSAWRCEGVPDAPREVFYAPLDAQCVAEGHAGVGAIPNYDLDDEGHPLLTGTWTTVCLAGALDVLLWIVSTQVQAALVGAITPD